MDDQQLMLYVFKAEEKWGRFAIGVVWEAYKSEEAEALARDKDDTGVFISLMDYSLEYQVLVPITTKLGVVFCIGHVE